VTVAVVVTGTSLTLEELLRVARGREPVELGGDVAERVRRGRAIVEEALASPAPVYGLTTGVGVRKRTRVEAEELDEFNRRLILEHRVGQGPPAAEDAVRAQLLLVVNSFARGTAGVRPELVEHLADRLNDGVAPVVRTLGSIGMSDLPPNADLAHGVLDGFALGAKEGIALLYHNAFSTALAALALADASTLLAALDVAAALDLEALGGNLSMLHDPDDPFRAILAGSYLWDEGAARSLQDPLSFRTAPRVHAAARDALAYAVARLERELNASQENPFVDLERGLVVGSANFDPVALTAALDFVRIALAPVLNAASERAVKLMQAPFTGLPEGLAVEAGLAESALSELGVPAQALAAEAKLLAQPVSVETGSTSHHEGIEDRITLAPLGARRLGEMVVLGQRLAAVELTIAAQAVDLRDASPLGAATARAHALVRELVPPLQRGMPLVQDLEPVRALVASGRLSG
jgi:histidine ammonia-lyase